MGIYSNLDEAALVAKIAELTAAYEKLATGGGVVKAGGEGRMMEWTPARSGDLKRLIREANEDLIVLRGGDPNSAIGVVFP